ncbi:MAG: dihydroorotate dehydrogenase-like protein [Chlorobi bacterium]|nr:dihydroorotate dehydrogenase-like protein [Chlorobiota bacterium]
MSDLTTKYLGLELKNPVIAGASNMITDLNIVRDLEKAGVAAIVYKSLFEEQIQLETLQLDQDLEAYNEIHAEMTSLFPKLQHAGPEEHLHHLKEVKESIDIPVFASLNAVFEPTWLEYAKKLQETGIDGLEINFYAVPKDPNKDEQKIVEEQVNILKKIKQHIKIPVAVKLSPFYTNALKVIHAMADTGVDGFVLFNRLFQPDINIDTETLHFPYNLSHPQENRLALRFAGLLYGETNASICANGGIFEGNDVIKMILAGADAVQVVSTLYKNKPGYVATILKDVSGWMEKKGYNQLEDFRGKLSRKHVKDPYAYKRAQYVDILMNAQEMEKIFPVH